MKKHWYFLQSEQKDGGEGGSGSGEGTGNNKGESGTQSDGGEGGQGSGGFDISALPAEAQKIIKDLRNENAKYRKSSSDLKGRVEKLEGGLKKLFGEDEEENLDPEVKIQQYAAREEALNVRSAILEMAIDNGITGADSKEYFEFLMMKRLNELGDDEELSEDELDEIVTKVKKGGASNSTSVGNGDEGGKKPPKGNEVTPEQFAKMGITEKSKLYQTNKELYQSLWTQAKAKGLL